MIKTSRGYFCIEKFEGMVDDYQLCEDNLMTFLAHIIDHEFCEALHSYEHYDVLIGTVLRLRKNMREYIAWMRDIVFLGYRECPYDIEAFKSVRGHKFLQVDIEDYIVQYPIEDYAYEQSYYYMSLYETFHDMVLVSLKNKISVDFTQPDVQVEAWMDYDHHQRIDWWFLEKHIIQKLYQDEIKVSTVARFRRNYCRKLNIKKRYFFMFNPLKYYHRLGNPMPIPLDIPRTNKFHERERLWRLMNLRRKKEDGFSGNLRTGFWLNKWERPMTELLYGCQLTTYRPNSLYTSLKVEL